MSSTKYDFVGFVIYVATFAVLILYFIWVLNIKFWDGIWIDMNYPDSSVAIALPAYILFVLAGFLFTYTIFLYIGRHM
jgi:hypothetical protein